MVSRLHLPGVISKLSLWFTFGFLFLSLGTLALLNTVQADETGTRSGSFDHTPTDVALAGASSASNNSYTSPELTAQFQFNGIGLTWTGSTTKKIEFALQIDGGQWNTLEMQGDDAKNQTEHYTSAPLFVSGQRVRYRITGDNAATVQNVHLVYFDSTIPPYHSLASTLKQTLSHSAQSSSNIISRSEWGADESYRTWEPEYETPDKIIIHHTAGGNGGSDPAATIRGIYYWHAQVLGWGDIGYNYIIDPDGNIYEGRYGGNAVIGAHAYNSATDTNYNVGSMGVVLLGCYEDTEGACSTVHEFGDAMKDALEELIASKAATYGFDPSGESNWYGEELPNVIGHRDVDSTYCPGNTVHDQLDAVRSAAHNLYSSAQVRSYAASYNNSSVASSYEVAATADLSLSYTNTGRKNWNKDKVVLQVKLVETGERHRFTLTNSVEDGAIADITGSLTLPTKSGEYTLSTRLYRKGSPIHGSKYQTKVTVENPYSVTVTSTTMPTAIQQGWQPTVSVTATNNGVTIPAGATLELDGQTLATLNTEWATDATQTFSGKAMHAASWPVGNHSAVLKIKTNGATAKHSRQVFAVRIDPVQ